MQRISRLEPGTHGSISVRATESGSYHAEARVRGWDGQVRKVSSSRSKEDEAVLALEKRIARQLQITNPDAEITAEAPFPVLARNWLADLLLDPQYSDGTKDVYASELRTLVMPGFEDSTVGDLTAARLERFIKLQHAKSYTKARHSKRILGHLIRYAMLHGALAYDPLQATSRLRRPKVRRKPLTIDEVNAIRDAASAWGEETGRSGPTPGRQMRDIIDVMLGSSARIGEALSLRRCDVDLTTVPPTIHISGTIVVRKRKGTYRQPFPKTTTPDRLVAIPEFTASVLRDRLATGDDADPDELVFSTRRGTPVSPYNIRRSLRHIVDLAGLAGRDIRPHTFRRTAAMLISEHAGQEVAAQTLGHSGTQTFRQHYLEQTLKANPVTAEILALLSPSSP
jgi:integrase